LQETLVLQEPNSHQTYEPTLNIPGAGTTRCLLLSKGGDVHVTCAESGARPVLIDQPMDGVVRQRHPGPEFGNLLGPQSLLLEVNTVKTRPVALLRRHAGGRAWAATHPMFGPFSFEKQGGTLNGLRLVITDHTLPEEDMAGAIAWLKGLGLNVLTMPAEAHDRMLAETLFLTHYVAQIVAKGGFVRTDIDTLSFGYLMDAVESVKGDTELFRDVFAFNPSCEDIIRRFEAAERDVHALLERG
ncbi:MAG: prephenate dehydrogenase, partial [Alphaproteobacteria bacterium]|nr:prephenate dehydrogenase [Alphaproteobacteria bacterium]